MICTVHSMMSCYELNKHTRTLTTNSFNTITLSIHQHDNLTIDINTLTLNTPNHFFLVFTYCIKNTNLQGTLRNYDPISQMYIFCPLTKLLNVDESRPLIVPHEFLQAVEVPILEFIHKTRYNHKLYNLIQNTPNELSPSTEEHNIIKALELPWPLLQNKHILRMLAKLLTSSDIIHDVFPHGFFTDE